jgi:Putative beta-lactamase-inhibitor-like, PepSY-like
MRKVLCCLALAGVAGFFLVSGGVEAGEEKVPLDKLPKAVVEAVKKRFPKAELVAAAKETVDKKTEYEVILKNEGQKIDVTLTPEGTILGMEKEITVKDLPKAVTTTLKKSYPKAVYKKVEEVIKVKDGKETLAFYEVLLEIAEKKTVEVKVEANGKILTPDAKDGEKKEEKKESGKQAGGGFDFFAETIALISAGRHSHFILNPSDRSPTSPGWSRMESRNM